jgi:hypothetical protein
MRSAKSLIRHYDLSSALEKDSSQALLPQSTTPFRSYKQPLPRTSPLKVRLRPVVSRTFYHSQFMGPMSWSELNNDSDDEVDLDWYLLKKEQVRHF